MRRSSQVGLRSAEAGHVSVNYGSGSPGRPTATGDQGPLLRGGLTSPWRRPTKFVPSRHKPIQWRRPMVAAGQLRYDGTCEVPPWAQHPTECGRFLSCVVIYNPSIGLLVRLLPLCPWGGLLPHLSAPKVVMRSSPQPAARLVTRTERWPERRLTSSTPSDALCPRCSSPQEGL